MMRSSNAILLPAAAILLLVISGCALFSLQPEPEEYVVEHGDTLYSIAWQNDLDYRELAAWNGIKPPYVIRPGQVLTLVAPEGFIFVPEQAGAATEPPPAITTTPLPSEEAPPEVRPADEPAPPPSVNVATTPIASPFKWRWPAEGEVLTVDTASGNPGIDIGGSLGQAVRAAASGRVVYSGSGLQGYGQLVIVKHEGNYLSAYGYNRRLLVRQGDEVHIGQAIAEMGEGPQRRAALHFEIRRDGKSLNPLQLLPPR